MQVTVAPASAPLRTFEILTVNEPGPRCVTALGENRPHSVRSESTCAVVCAKQTSQTFSAVSSSPTAGCGGVGAGAGAGVAVTVTVGAGAGVAVTVTVGAGAGGGGDPVQPARVAASATTPTNRIGFTGAPLRVRFCVGDTGLEPMTSSV